MKGDHLDRTVTYVGLRQAGGGVGDDGERHGTYLIGKAPAHRPGAARGGGVRNLRLLVCRRWLFLAAKGEEFGVEVGEPLGHRLGVELPGCLQGAVGQLSEPGVVGQQ